MNITDENFSRFSIPTPFQRENLCFSDGMGIENKPDFRIDRGSFDNYLVMYVTRGCLRHEQCGEKIAVMPGEAVFVNLKVWHLYYFPQGESSCIWWLHLNGALVEEMAARIGKIHPLPLKLRCRAMKEGIEACFESSGESLEEKIALSARIYELLLLILREACRQYPVSGGEESSSRFREEAAAVISQAVYEPVSLETLAARMHLSKYHFCRTFREQFGLPPMQYLMREKLHIAGYHLLYTNDRISDIAEALGFGSTAYFSRVFKEEFGVSPAFFREEQRHSSRQIDEN